MKNRNFNVQKISVPKIFLCTKNYQIFRKYFLTFFTWLMMFANNIWTIRPHLDSNLMIFIREWRTFLCRILLFSPKLSPFFTIVLVNEIPLLVIIVSGVIVEEDWSYLLLFCEGVEIFGDFPDYVISKICN